MNKRAVRIRAKDDYPLAGTLFEPAIPNGCCALIVPACGVRRRLYSEFAGFLAERGFSALTWDWRGTGDSRPPSLRGFSATMRDWGVLDLGGVIDWALTNAGDRVCAVAHSFGGQGLGLAENCTSVDRIVTVGSQSGYLGFWPWRDRLRYGLLWYAALPALTRVIGWFPARWFGLGEDLPRGVALEWASWCRSPQYLGTWGGHASISAPLLAICFSDDAYAPRSSFEWIHERYGSPVKVLRWIEPREAGVSYVGHFGFFRKDLVPGIWEEAVDWLAGSRIG